MTVEIGFTWFKMGCNRLCTFERVNECVFRSGEGLNQLSNYQCFKDDNAS
jgi:hypothetical protein